MTAAEPSPSPNSIYLHGLWLEGADWDVHSQSLVETTKGTRFVQFPVVKLTIPLSSELSPAARRHTAANFLDASTGLNARIVKHTSSSLKRRSPDDTDRSRSSMPAREGGSALRLARAPAKREGGGHYKCPLYKSALRLAAQRGAAPERGAVEHIKLNSSERVSKWVKRGVALILEAEYDP